MQRLYRFIPFLSLFLVIAMALGAMASMTFAHHDQYRHLMDKGVGWNRCSLDPQYAGLTEDLGRPIQGWVECAIFQVVRERSDFLPVRWLAIFLLSVFAYLLYRFQTRRCGFNPILAGATAVGIALLPGFVNLVMMANLPNLLAAIFAVKGYECRDRSRRSVASVLWTLAALFTYPPCAFSYWIPSVCRGLALPARERTRRILFDLIFFTAMAALYIGLVKFVIHPLVHFQPDPRSPYAFLLSFRAAEKLSILGEMAIAISNLWNIYPKAIFGGLGLLLVGWFIGRDRLQLKYVGLVIAIAIFSLSPILFSNFGTMLYRTMTTASALWFLLLVHSARAKGFALGLVITAAVLSGYHSIQSARNSQMEFDKLSTALVGMQGRVIAIFGADGLKADSYGLNGLPSRTDEFNVNTSSFSIQEIAWMVMSARREASRPAVPIIPCERMPSECPQPDGSWLVVKNRVIPEATMVDLR